MKNLLLKFGTAALLFALYFAPSAAFAQVDRIDVATVKDGYVMVDNEMLAVNSGKLTKMNKTVKMENGTKIKKNGVVKAKGKKRVKMRNGNCVDKSGKIEDCNIDSQPYSCKHHNDIRASKPGKCSQCGMELAKRN
ncbi:MAG: hypothetical protein ITG00_01460 [Flavobacterium sp.]|nr:hypothetical protein [Flavobacterium sp.]